MERLILSLGLGLLLLGACAPGEGGQDAGGEENPASLSWLKENVFAINCVPCHDTTNASYIGFNPLDDTTAISDLVDVDAESAELSGSYKLVVAGDPDSSLLYTSLLDVTDNLARMPAQSPSLFVVGDTPGPELSAEKKDALKQWIEDGAEDN
jgi:hypothetical protein